MSLFTKNTTPSLVAAGLIITSYALPIPVRTVILNIGLFALSGALTNWLAIHMLFQRVPGLYGSGVIPLHFEEFKTGILALVTRHLFKRENVEAALSRKSGAQSDNAFAIDLASAIDSLDLDVAYDQLTAVIMESSFGAMLGMVGGAQALEPMRDPFKKRMRTFLQDTTRSPRFQKALAGQLSSMAGSEQFLEKIREIVQDRLNELTPEMVRDIVQEMIKKHLGWLVVWGGVFGGLIGLLVSVAPMIT